MARLIFDTLRSPHVLVGGALALSVVFVSHWFLAPIFLHLIYLRFTTRTRSGRWP